ncbi:MAG: hypothetical protein ACK5YW_03285 [Betaproteobacteria bacterium]|nr:hypothetical protein [Rhodocyclaceae bacterium]MCA3135400.1 hypothetical protein [Rhodocyclaceae bacterium]MCA3143671.1 hypothetical protein [Rhodocyclaceae bacterium]MCA3144439.1 hypothetical protein [Rhodocyclaceae bacterium]MCE2897524.1 hypothetical protein [Betaproteobacteria bacterium]
MPPMAPARLATSDKRVFAVFMRCLRIEPRREPLGPGVAMADGMTFPARYDGAQAR